MSKPRIRYIGMGWWRCGGMGVCVDGLTPLLAYEGWLDTMELVGYD